MTRGLESEISGSDKMIQDNDVGHRDVIYVKEWWFAPKYGWKLKAMFKSKWFLDWALISKTK